MLPIGAKSLMKPGRPPTKGLPWKILLENKGQNHATKYICLAVSEVYYLKGHGKELQAVSRIINRKLMECHI